MPFLDKFSYRMERILRHQGYSNAFYPLLIIGHLFRVKNSVRGQYQSGVHSLALGQYPAIYVGQTCHSISQRMKEHLFAYTNNAPHRSTFTRHLLDSGHPFQGSRICLMHEALKGRLLNELEEAIVVDTVCNPNVTIVNNEQFTMFDNFINFTYKLNDVRTSNLEFDLKTFEN